MMKPDLVIQSRRVLLPEGCRPAAIAIKDGLILEVLAYGQGEAMNLGSLVVMPGLVDTHVHVNEPGRAHWEGFESATRAAAAGGITTLVDMPLNSIPVTTTAASLEKKLAAAQGRCHVDCAFWGGLVPGNLGELEPLLAAGVLGFKAFLVDSGIEEFPPARAEDLEKAMPLLAKHGAPLLAHAELALPQEASRGDPRSYGTYLESRPRSWENEAVSLLSRLCRRTRCRVHVVHLSSAEALATVARAKAEGLPMTTETCPHYLGFAAEEIPQGRTEFKCSPPIRERENRERLWEALRAGTIDFVVSDHSPCPPEMKALEAGDFGRAWGGISSLQLTLPAVWTEARRRGFVLEDLPRWLCEGPARFAGLGRKGRIAPGLDADLAAWDPDASFEVAPAMLRHRHKLTPYAGRRLQGRVALTFLRGVKIYEEGLLLGEPLGRPLAALEPQGNS